MSVQAPTNSLFPVLPTIDPNQAYDVVIATAQNEFKKYDDYAAKALEIGAKLTAWTDRHTGLTNKTIEPMPDNDVLNPEFWDKIDQYIEYRNMRDDMVKIIAIYDKVIAFCQPPVLDRNTLAYLQNMKIDVAAVKTRYDEIFTTHLAELKEQREKVKAVYDQVVPELRKLRLSLEPLAVLRSDYPGWFAVPSTLNGYVKRTAYVNDAVTQRMKEMAEATAGRSSAPATAETTSTVKASAGTQTESTPGERKEGAPATSTKPQVGGAPAAAPPKPTVTYSKVAGTGTKGEPKKTS